METYQIAYIVLAVLIWFIGYLHTGRFVRPKWKLPGKFITYIGISIWLTLWIGQYGLIFILAHPLIGLIFHTIICHKHKINWLTCKPEEKYLNLTEKWAKGDFSKQIKEQKSN